MIRLTTNFGTIDIELDYKNAPVTASNFEQYVKDGHYNGLIFHRVIPGFMIQGGGFKPGMDEVDTREPIKNEANNGLSNEKYTIDFKSETMQGWGYAVFGKVVAGQDVVDKIAKVRTGRVGWYDDVPTEDVVIEKAEVI